jgi:hypothetical protein
MVSVQQVTASYSFSFTQSIIGDNYDGVKFFTLAISRECPEFPMVRFTERKTSSGMLLPELKLQW